MLTTAIEASGSISLLCSETGCEAGQVMSEMISSGAVMVDFIGFD